MVCSLGSQSEIPEGCGGLCGGYRGDTKCRAGLGPGAPDNSGLQDKQVVSHISCRTRAEAELEPLAELATSEEEAMPLNVL